MLALHEVFLAVLAQDEVNTAVGLCPAHLRHDEPCAAEDLTNQNLKILPAHVG